MTTAHINHNHIAGFADSHVNLRRDDRAKYTKQVNGLRERLEHRLKEDSEFKLRKMLLSGSLAKGTALKSINDIDVALYVLQSNPPKDMPEFIDWLVATLRGLYPNMAPEQITPQSYSVRISFKGTGLDVDIVPISYNGNLQWDGYLYSANSNDWLMTNIPKHLKFIQTRKKQHPIHFRQIARLLKFWVKEIKKRDDSFRFKSFLIELILAHLTDAGRIKLDDYVEALADYFNFIVAGGLDKIILFDDYYRRDQVADDSKPIRIFDPVNPKNNAAKDYTYAHKAALVKAAGEAADAVDAALYATTKGETVRYWQKIFGSSFGG